MKPESSLNHSLDNAKKHYSSMFFLPSYKKSLVALAFLCILCVSLATAVIFPSIGSLVIGITVFAITVTTDVLASKLTLKKDPIFTIRRTLAMSFYGWLLWIAFIAIGAGVGTMFGPLLWVKLSLLGFAAVITLRTIVLTATSFAAKWQQLLTAFLQPMLCIISFVVLWISTATVALLQVLPFIVFAPIITYLAVYVFLHTIDRLGKNTYALPTLRMFRAFILNWVTDLNGPLEEHLEEMGEDSDIEVSLLKFSAKKTKAAFILPLVHPGPFKNVGSSLLPSLLKEEFEIEFDCTACVPLGILGHELDLASQAQNRKIVSRTISEAKFETPDALASPFVRATEGYATASCQIFGNVAFLSFSLAPKTTEDLPQELGRMVREEAKKYGLETAIVVNAHNCLTDVVDTEEHLGALEKAASKCIKQASELPKVRFKVGAASVFPQEFTAKQGMGTGGITAIVVEVQGQKTAYIVIDGNNMIPGLREKLIAVLQSGGFDQTEIFTTDTHAVSALVTGRRGYHPVGEAMDQDALVRWVGEAANKARANLEDCKVGYKQFVVPHVRVIGEERLRSVTTLVDKALVKAKHIVAPIFGLEGLALILLLLIF
ncbi:MAG: DUF2070 family protein [Candidatus Bathyarchaeota archaeon]|nr:DUF2070 family protein [Candidatus Bathyarchaeota archaeon]